MCHRKMEFGDSTFLLCRQKLDEKTGQTTYKSINFPLALSLNVRTRIESHRMEIKTSLSGHSPTSDLEVNVYRQFKTVTEMNELRDFKGILEANGEGFLQNNIAFDFKLDTGRFYSLDWISSLRFDQNNLHGLDRSPTGRTHGKTQFRK